MLNNEEVMHALEKGEISVDEALTQLTSARATDGNGLSIGTVVAIRRPNPERNGEYITETRSSGYRDWDNTETVEPDDVFRIYSVTKTFTADVIKHLQQEGKLHLDDKLNTWIQKISIKNSEAGHTEWNSALEKLNIHPDATIEDLLLHRSGIGNYSQGAFIAAANSAPGKYWSLYDLFAYNVVEKVGIDKNDAYGTFCYSDTGYNFLALIAEHASGKSYETLVQESCSQEGLHTTCFTPQAKEMEFKETVNLAQGYILNPKSGKPASSMDYDTGKGTGGLLSTGEEMLIWAKRFYLESGVSKQNIIPIVGKIPSRCGESQYGYGIMAQDNGSGRKLYGHGGYARGGRSKVFYYPDSDTSIVTLESFETITPMIARGLAQEHSAFKDINKTTLLLRDSYTDGSGKFNRSQLLADWQKGKSIIIGRVSEKLCRDGFNALDLATFVVSPQAERIAEKLHSQITTKPLDYETKDKGKKGWATKMASRTSSGKSFEV